MKLVQEKNLSNLKPVQLYFWPKRYKHLRNQSRMPVPLIKQCINLPQENMTDGVLSSVFIDGYIFFSLTHVRRDRTLISHVSF